MFGTLRRISFTLWIFIGMVLGALVGWLYPDFAADLKPLSTAFLRMIKSVVAPILFGTLVMGIAVFMVLNQLKIAPAIVQITYIALLGSVALGAALAFGLGGRDVAARLLNQAYSKGQENKDQVKQDMQLGKDRAQDQAQAAKDKADSQSQDSGAPTPGAYRRQ